MSVSPYRIIVYVGGLGLGLAAGLCLGDVFYSEDAVQDFFVTIYSILVGFLVAVLAILLDPGVILRGSWRTAHLQRAELRRRFIRHLFIFYAYLTTLALILVLKIGMAFPIEFTYMIAHWTAFFGIASFVWSFDLPISLYLIQKDKFDAIVDARKSPAPD